MNKPNPTDATEVICRLRAVTRRIESFFESQTENLRLALSQFNDSQSEYDVTKRLSAELEQERRSWEARRDQEISRLTQASEELALAWQELEQRQRDFDLAFAAANRETGSAEMPGTSVNPATAVSIEEDGGQLEVYQMEQLRMQVHQHSRNRLRG